MQAPAKNIDEYIARYPEEVQVKLQKLRETIRKAAPKATEAISYGIPTFKYLGNLVHFGGFKQHLSFFPGASGVAAFEKELGDYETSKGTIQLPLDKALPLKLVRDIVKFRVAQAEETAALKAGKKKKK
jgi:uncharacterized protein YdhG (YjbR/CyaY superfamily)